MRPVDHQVHIQKHWRMLAHGLHDRDADRDIRHKNAVHYVNMDIVRAAGLDLTDVLAECAKVQAERMEGASFVMDVTPFWECPVTRTQYHIIT